MAAQITVSFGESPPKFHGIQEMADAIGISVARLISLRTSFRDSNLIDKGRTLHSVVDKQAFATEVVTWLSVELSAVDIANIYGRPNPPHPPSLSMYAIIQYFKNHPKRMALPRGARAGGNGPPVPDSQSENEDQEDSGRDDSEDQEDIGRADEDAPPLSDGESGNEEQEDSGRADAPPGSDGQSENEDQEDSGRDDSEDPEDIGRADNGRINPDDEDREMLQRMEEDDELRADESDGVADELSVDEEGERGEFHGGNNPSDEDHELFEWMRDYELQLDDSEGGADAGGDESSAFEGAVDGQSDNENPDMDDEDAGENESSAFESTVDRQSDNENPDMDDEDEGVELNVGMAAGNQSSPSDDEDVDQAAPQSDFQIVASASRNWAQYISNANPNTLDSDFWTEYQKYMQIMQAFERSNVGEAPHHRSGDSYSRSIDSYSRFLIFHIRIRGDLGPVSAILEHRTPKFRNVWGPEALNEDVVEPFTTLVNARKPVFLVAAGSTGAGKTHTLCRPNPGDPPVLEVLLLKALRVYGNLKLKLLLLQGFNITRVPFTVDQVKGKGKGRALPTLRQFLTTAAEVLEFVDAWHATQRTADNGLNPRSSRWHSLVDVISDGKLVLSLLDLCGDECSTIRAGPLKEESTTIAGDLEKLRTLVSDLKLSRRVRRVPRVTFSAINGRGSCLTREVVLRLRSGVFDNMHVVLCGDGNADIERIQSTCDTWRPLRKSHRPLAVAGGLVAGGQVVAGPVEHGAVAGGVEKRKAAGNMTRATTKRQRL